MMTRELIIDGQHVDLPAQADIALEYVNDFTGDPGKISLSHSYTIKLPKTTRNARILDDPDTPGHASGSVRRYLDARYYRNGIDLIGAAQAYILKTTADSYEVALVWNDLEALHALSQGGAALNDLPDLPVPAWVGSKGTPDYTGASDADGVVWASYASGLGASLYPEVNAATHPAMDARNLLDRIMTAAEVPCTVSPELSERMADLVVLAAPGHQPSVSMEIASGSTPGRVGLYTATVNNRKQTRLYLNNWANGWDAPTNATAENTTFNTGDSTEHRMLLNMLAPLSVDLSGWGVVIYGRTVESNTVKAQEELSRVYFTCTDEGWRLYATVELKLSGWSHYAVALIGAASLVDIELSAYDPGLPRFAVYRKHNSIDITNDNRFPLAGNLPDIKQWDYVKALMAILGGVAVIQNGRLHLLTHAELTDTASAADWTSKVDMSTAKELSYALNNWARENIIAYKEDTPLGFDPDAVIRVSDDTIKDSRDLFELPFAASQGSIAPHYKIDKDRAADDENIAPRVFRLERGNTQRLRFTEDMYGAGLVETNYSALQKVVRTPVAITLNARLSELDLAQLDLTRPVYLGQYGHYYSILKIQTSDTDLCKLELLQIA